MVTKGEVTGAVPVTYRIAQRVLRHRMPIAPVQDIIAELRDGRMVILVDEEERENEGDLVIAADRVTPEAINFMAKFGRGLICMPITDERARQLSLAPMTAI